MAQATQAVLTDAIKDLAEVKMPITRGCQLVGMPRATFYRLTRNYRHYRPVAQPLPHKQRTQPAALSSSERQAIVAVLCEEQYADASVVQTYWQAFDAGKVTCSQRTFYRVAKDHHLVGDRRPTRTHRTASRRAPAVAAGGVGDLWSWDVTELRGPGRQRYYLYLVIDVFSRCPVGWRIEYIQEKKRAVDLFTTALTTHGVPRTIHSDNGSIQRAHELIDALHERGITTSYSRPRVSDDNPFSESLFKTIKYDPACPEQFDSIDHARSWTAAFLERYSNEHRHSALGRHTPAQVHYGVADQVQHHRQRLLDQYWAQHPERFRRRPTAPQLPQPTGINTHLLSQAG